MPDTLVADIIAVETTRSTLQAAEAALELALPPIGEERTALLTSLIEAAGGRNTPTGQALACFKLRDDIKRRRTLGTPPTPIPDFARWRLGGGEDLGDWYYLCNTRYRRYPIPEGPMADWQELVQQLRAGNHRRTAGTRLAWTPGMGIYSPRNHEYGDREAFALNAEHAGAVADWLEARLNIFLDKAKAPG